MANRVQTVAGTRSGAWLRRAGLAAAIGWCAGLGAVVACSSPDAKPSAQDAAASDTPTTDAFKGELPPGAVCVPGSTEGCATSQHVKRCAADGSGYVSELCTDPEGNTTACYNPGVCAQCQIGAKRCNPDDSTLVEACSGDGQWQKGQICDAQQGLQCTAAGLCQKACDVNVKAKSYVGCSFWATDLDNAFVPGGSRGYFDAANAQYAIVVSNPSDKLSATISIDSNEGKQTVDAKGVDLDYSPLAPGELRVFNLPPRNINATAQQPLAWRVNASAPIAAYQFNPLENVGVFSNDASLLLPDELLGKWYIAMSREESFSILRGFVTVIAAMGGKTTVTVTFSKTTLRTLKSSDGTIKSYDCRPGSTSQQCSAEFVLNQWDALNIETDEVGGDLTGTEILADKRVAVFAGSEAANAPNTNHCLTDACTDAQIQSGAKCGVCAWDGKTGCNNNDHCSAFITCCADHLEMQMFPIKTWGNQYVGVKLFPRGKEMDSWRIIAGTDGTKIALSPTQKNEKGETVAIPVLDKGEWFEFQSSGSFEILAKHDDGSPAPIMVGHFMQSQDAPDPNVDGAQDGDAGTGDPAFLLAIPVQQWRASFVFLTPDKYSMNYISIAAPIDAEVSFDGSPIAPDLFQNITKNYKFTRLYVNTGTHTVKAAPVKQPDGTMQPRTCAVDVYGFDQYVSYGYPAGLDLKDLAFVKEPGE